MLSIFSCEEEKASDTKMSEGQKESGRKECIYIVIYIFINVNIVIYFLILKTTV